MKFEVTLGTSVQTEQYNQMKFEVTVGLDHRDLGLSDSDVVALGDNDWADNFRTLTSLVRESAEGELQLFLQRAAKVSVTENLATRLTDQTPSRPARRKR